MTTIVSDICTNETMAIDSLSVVSTICITFLDKQTLRLASF